MSVRARVLYLIEATWARVAFILIVTMQSAPVHAAVLFNPLKYNNLPDFLFGLIDIVVLIGTPIAAFFIILAGFKFATARGNEETIKDARKTLISAIIGAAVLMAAKTIAIVLQQTVDSISTTGTGN